MNWYSIFVFGNALRTAGERIANGNAIIMFEIALIGLSVVALRWLFSAIGLGPYAKYVNTVGLIAGAFAVLDLVWNFLTKIATVFMGG